MQTIDMNSAEFSDIYLQIRRACHDLNAPLRAVHGFADILQQREADHLSQRGQLYLQRMVSATHHMEQVVSGLHHYARLATWQLQWEPIDLDSFSQQLLGAYYPTPLANGELTRNGAEQLQPWTSDRELLKTIVCALVDNGLRFTEQDHAPDVSLQWAMDGGRLQLTVTDHGIGIEEEHQQRIFQLFERLHSRDRYPGAGTGLTQALKATQLLRGRISIDAAPGQGTTIQVSLPPAESLSALKTSVTTPA